MGYNPRTVDPAKIVRIEVLDLPTAREPGEGEYELRWGNKPKEPVYYDIVTLLRELEQLVPTEAENILDRLQNFKTAYINLATGEITS